jgi:trans-aconitate 2-methyltransferase
MESKVSWEPERYLKYDSLRLRPALDLLARVTHDGPRRVLDLGCGPGTVTTLLAERWPNAVITGVDSSTEMLARAVAAYPGLRWVEADIAHWQAEEPVDVIFSNAALHWLDDHETLFPRLAASLATGGVLAVQMPANFDAPSHRIIRALASSAGWAPFLAGARMGSVMGVEQYWSVLTSLFDKVELWETVYWQRLQGENAVLEWLRGTTLVPYLARLDEGQCADFLSELGAELLRAYPVRERGEVLFPFKRLFMIGSTTR